MKIDSKIELKLALDNIIVGYKDIEFKGDETGLLNLIDYKEFLEDVLSLDLSSEEAVAEATDGLEAWEVALAKKIIRAGGIPWVKKDGSTVILSISDLKKIITKIRMAKKRIYELYFTGNDIAEI